MQSFTVIVKIKKKHTVYIPKKVLEKIGVGEEDFLRIKVEDGKIIIEPIQNPFKPAVNSRRWAAVTVSEIEGKNRE
ncbi:MAG: AbrB/MazE/SpoVT family DNA-binding domain-containing protein [Candidatus Asgardarchaeia archaeon]